MTPTEREVLRETLIGARWLIREPRLWVKGRSFDGERCCAWAAIDMAASMFREPDASNVAHGARLFVSADLGRSLPAWQDAPERTHAEVLALFDRAIERLS